jgi:phosphoribosylamine--glycine ligase
VSAGGRVLSVTAIGSNLEGARGSAYEAISRISLPGCRYRTDIGDPSRIGAAAADTSAATPTQSTWPAS